MSIHSNSDTRASKITSHYNDKPSLLNLSQDGQDNGGQHNKFSTHGYINLEFQDKNTHLNNKYSDFDSKIKGNIGDSMNISKDFKLITYVHAISSLFNSKDYDNVIKSRGNGKNINSLFQEAVLNE